MKERDREKDSLEREREKDSLERERERERERKMAMRRIRNEIICNRFGIRTWAYE